MSESAKDPSALRPSRRGSDFSDRQIYQAVKQGKAVQFVTVCGEKVTGWVFGMDDYHWGVVTPTGEVHCVHKSAPLMTVTDHLLERQAVGTREDIEPLVQPFYERVMREHFRTSPVPA